MFQQLGRSLALRSTKGKETMADVFCLGVFHHWESGSQPKSAQDGYPECVRWAGGRQIRLYSRFYGPLSKVSVRLQADVISGRGHR